MAKGKRTNPPREEAPRRDIAGNTQNARGGRQQRPLDPGERVVMNFRVTPELKQRLGRSAELSGRSLTQEIEFRLDKSFAEQDQAELFHPAVYSQKVAGLLAIFTRVMRDVGGFASLYSTGSIDRAEWLSNAYAFNQVDRAINACIEAIRPPGDPSPPPDKGQGYDLSKLGAMIAARLLQAVAHDEIGGELGEWAKPVRDKLDGVAARIKDCPLAYPEVVAVPTIWPGPHIPGVLAVLGLDISPAVEENHPPEKAHPNPTKKGKRKPAEIFEGGAIIDRIRVSPPERVKP